MNRDFETTGQRKQTPAVSLTDVTRRYTAGRQTRTALDGLSVDIARGQWLALLGPNGSGKSTMMRLIATLERPDSGQVEVLGFAPKRHSGEIRQKLAVVFQSPGLDGLLTVRENLFLQAAIYNMSDNDARDRIKKLADDLGITDRLFDRVSRLSGGFARRVDLARALVTRPKLLLLDEPTTGLDLEARRGFLGTIEKLREQDSALTIVMSTHLMDEAERADRVALMNEGQMVAIGSPDELRREMGERIITTDLDQEDTLRACGLRVRTTGRSAMGSGADDAMLQACANLVEVGVAFRIGPATLADVYMAHAGRQLDGDAQAVSDNERAVGGAA